jgi:hypothetical protein
MQHVRNVLDFFQVGSLHARRSATLYAGAHFGSTTETTTFLIVVQKIFN